MNLLMILYLVLVSPPIEIEKNIETDVELTSSKLIKPTKKPIEESSVYYYAPTKWVKNK